MSNKKSKYDEAAVIAVAGLAAVDLPVDRIALVVAAGAPTHELIKKMNAIDLGETAPATAFAAAWK